MPSLVEALAYLGIDYADESVRRNVSRSLKAAEGMLRGAVGDDVTLYLPDDPRVEELTLIYLDDLYSERGVSAKVSGATRRLVESMETQLRLELRAKKEAAGGS
ncbi:MAG: phage gp6-like head-tail connector protein [Butyricicoccus sp.]|nr:phage gp6-like head-tail connector protein [Butyricicoccus sp.]MBQ8585603.1 phage gp6-like head-tail connector protein [Butyricicoccus sp.]